MPPTDSDVNDLSLSLTSPYPGEGTDKTTTTKINGWFEEGNFHERVIFHNWTGFNKKVDAAYHFGSHLEKKKFRSAYLALELTRDYLKTKSFRSETDIKSIIPLVLRAANVVACQNPDCVIPKALFVAEQSLRSEYVAKEHSSSPKDTNSSASEDSVYLDHPEAVRADYCLFEEDEEKRGIPLATVEVKGPFARLISNDEYETPVKNDKEVANILNRLFEMPMQKMSGSNEYIFANRFGQGLTQAIHSKSGCGMLTTFNSSLFFYCKGITHEKHNKNHLEICVSQLFQPHQMVAAISTWILEAQRLAGIQDESSMKERSRTMKRIIKFFGNDAFLQSPRKSSMSPQKKKARKNSINKTKCETRTNSKQEISDNDLETSSYSEMNYKHRYQLWEFYLRKFISKKYEQLSALFDACRDDHKVRNILTECYDVVRSGENSTVMKSRIDETAIIVKYWNRSNEIRRMTEIYNEGVLYCHLITTGVVGLAVPKLIAIGIHYWVGVVVCTEHVGKTIERHEDGQFVVDGETLSLEDVHDLGRTAVQSLKVLHQGGVIHNDVELRNLRVQRLFNENVGKEKENNKYDDTNEKESRELMYWRAWWIDLGLSQLETSPEKFSAELAHCERIFNLDCTETS